MIRKILLLSLALAAQMTFGFAGAAETLDDLLAETQKARKAEAEESKKREAEFLASRDRQKPMLDEAQSKWNAAKARSDSLSAQFDANEVTLADLETKLKSREGNLGELFGVTRQVAGDSSAIVYNSLTSAQFPGATSSSPSSRRARCCRRSPSSSSSRSSCCARSPRAGASRASRPRS